MSARIDVESEIRPLFAGSVINCYGIRRQIVYALTQRLQCFSERRAFWSKSIGGHPALEAVVNRAQVRSRMKDDGSHAVRNGKGDRDKFIQGGFIVATAHRAMITLADVCEARKTFDNASAHRAEQQPIHLEQPCGGRVNEQVDRLRLTGLGPAPCEARFPFQRTT
jgi:hypothetical protein